MIENDFKFLKRCLYTSYFGSGSTLSVYNGIWGIIYNLIINFNILIGKKFEKVLGLRFVAVVLCTLTILCVKMDINKF